MEEDSDFFSPNKNIKLSESVTSALGVSPVVIDRKRTLERRKESVFEKGKQCMNKFVKLHEEFIGEISDSVNLDEYPFESDDLKHMVEKLRKYVEEKSKEGRIGDVISILRLAPHSWPKRTVAKYFGVQVSFVTRSKILLHTCWCCWFSFRVYVRNMRTSNRC